MKDTKGVIDTLIECILEGDSESFRGVLYSHLRTTNKLQWAKKIGIGRRTLYDLLDPKKKFNPEFETISAILKNIAA